MIDDQRHAARQGCLSCWPKPAQRAFVELFDLDDTALWGCMKEVQVAAKVLKEVAGAVKINYEMHGNTAPHLHMHLFPPYLDDQAAAISLAIVWLGPNHDV
jgi:diadenosine tetraphosphate (Ap4A) HIT family hydrolase